jgi:dCMP deaminase
MTRIGRDALYMQMAELMAKRSTCERGHVGVVLVQDRRLVGAGYNGAPAGQAQCIDPGVGCEPIAFPGEPPAPVLSDSWKDERLETYGCQRAIHAEANAIAWAARHGVPLAGATIYCTHQPCKVCAQLIVAAQLHRFVWLKPYRAGRLDILDAACIHIAEVPV